jgi:hypothetical protein
MEKEKPIIKTFSQEDIEKILDANNALNKATTSTTPVGQLPILYSVVQRQEQQIKLLDAALKKADDRLFWRTVIFSSCMLFAIGCQFFPLFYNTQQPCDQKPCTISISTSRDQGDTCSNPWFNS